MRRLDALLNVERTTNGKPAVDRLCRQDAKRAADDRLCTWFTAQPAILSRNHYLAMNRRPKLDSAKLLQSY
ncbi:hypothetical protein GCM10008023_41330 [Sphingomonas glacialis]|uniref:Uncharacterized protein n=1 Tax=Sphingomonas glacialis TaxID=658225 RepID=A0ABQ3M4G9_9SPHN|nr:hypothetical protein GCM10008023_41330 [Sphingomonas glacialis]